MFSRDHSYVFKSLLLPNNNQEQKDTTLMLKNWLRQQKQTLEKLKLEFIFII